MKIFKLNNKKQKFVSEGQSAETNSEGIKYEYKNNLITKIFLCSLGILGFVLCIMDIRDEGSLFKFSMGNTKFLYTGSLIGVAIILISIIMISVLTPKVNLKK